MSRAETTGGIGRTLARAARAVETAVARGARELGELAKETIVAVHEARSALTGTGRRPTTVPTTARRTDPHTGTRDTSGMGPPPGAPARVNFDPPSRFGYRAAGWASTAIEGAMLGMRPLAMAGGIPVELVHDRQAPRPGRLAGDAKSLQASARRMLEQARTTNAGKHRSTAGQWAQAARTAREDERRRTTTRGARGATGRH